MEYTCPNCHKPIYDDEALLCLYCGESLKRPTRTTLGKIKQNKYKLILVVIVVLLVISFLFLQF